MSDALKEYELLRQEIADNSKLVATVFMANTAFTAAIVGAGLGMEKKYGPVFFAPLLILIPSLYFIASQLESTTRISQYLRVMLEPKLEIKWQTNWFELRERGLLPKGIKYIPAVSGLYGSLSIICLILAYVYWPEGIPESYYFWIVAAVSFPLVAAVFTLQNAFSARFRNNCAEAWMNLRRLHDAQASQHEGLARVRSTSSTDGASQRQEVGRAANMKPTAD